MGLFKILPKLNTLDLSLVDIPVLLSIDPSLRQIVTKPTRGGRILDVVATNLWKYNNEPVIVPPILPDKPGHGAPSDHSGVLVTPLASQTQRHCRTKVTKVIRPLPESLFHIFDEKLAAIDFSELLVMEIDQMIEKFQNTVNGIVCAIFPEITIIISSEDKPWYNEELRILKRQRMREYERHGKSDKYLQIRLKYDEKLKTEMLKYLEKIVIEVSEGRRGSCYPALKKLGLQPGHESQASFQLPAHLDLSAAQSAELIAAHFSSISQEYEPVQTSSLSPNIQEYLSRTDTSTAPVLTFTEVFKRIKKTKKPNLQDPGDLPPKLSQTLCVHASSASYKHFEHYHNQSPVPKPVEN